MTAPQLAHEREARLWDSSDRETFRFDIAELTERLSGTLMYQYADYEEAVRRIASGDIYTDPLETKHFSFAEFAAAYEFIDQEGPRSMKVFIDL